MTLAHLFKTFTPAVIASGAKQSSMLVSQSGLPRYRYDQLMRLGWKVFLPISLLWVFLVSGWLMYTRYGG